jgi:hypothetical protein
VRFQKRLERALHPSANDCEIKDARTAVKREARRLTCLAFGALVSDGALRQRIVGRIRDRLHVLCSLETWNPRAVIRSFLDRSETGVAVALAYDWTYAELDAGIRSAVEEALLAQLLTPAIEAYRDASADWPRRRDNLTVVSNAGIMISALALLPRHRELCNDALEHGFASMWRAFEAFAPDGAWPEGPSYWSLSVRHACLAIAALESSLGSSFGLASRPGFAQTGDFILHATGPFGAAFDFGDSTPDVDLAALAWFAHRFKRPMDGWLAADYDGWHLPWTLLWNERPAIDPEASGTPTGKVFRGSGLAGFRSSWSRSPEARPVFVAIKGANTPALESDSSEVPIHAQADAGSFVVDGAHTRWVLDLGPDEYDLPGYFEHGTSEAPGRRWRYYRNSTAGHNTLLVGGRNQYPGAAAPALGSQVAGDCKWVVFDLSAAYGQPSGTIRRGAALIGRHVIIQDEVSASISEPVEWVVHTAADPVAVGSRIAHFRCDADRFRVQILEPENTELRLGAPPPARAFELDSRAELHGACIPRDGRVKERDRRYSNPGSDSFGRAIRRLEIPWPSGAQRLTVLLSPDFDGAAPAIRTAPLDQWLSEGPLRIIHQRRLSPGWQRSTRQAPCSGSLIRSVYSGRAPPRRRRNQQQTSDISSRERHQ